MNDNVDNLVLEHLRSLRENDQKTHNELAELKHHILAMRESISQLAREDTQIYYMLAEHGSRLERIEARLNLAEAENLHH